MTKLNVIIIDYGMGNIKSVMNSIKKIGYSSKLSNDPEDIINADAIILPGVGAFGEAMDNLKKLNLIDPIIEYSTVLKKPIMGICLGMQLLANSSDERGSHDGLSLIPGNVAIIPTPDGLVLPHVGWNDISITLDTPLYNNINNLDCFYFVHSYYFDCKKEYISASVNYGKKIAASVQSNNIFGVQFHPEKSQTKGIRLIENFLSYAVSYKENLC
jgi:imidazole glycerol-phosphate synthase subunit HisH